MRFLHLKEAVEHLNTLQSNAATLEAMRVSGAPTKPRYAIPEMTEFLGRIGYQVCESILCFGLLGITVRCSLFLDCSRKTLIDSTLYMLLGRKGKDLPAPSSTLYYGILFLLGKSVWERGIRCLSCSSLYLCVYIGLYTSPHLVAVRERIRINGEAISEELFARFFFNVWDRLESTTTVRHFRPIYNFLRTHFLRRSFLTNFSSK